MLDRQVTLSSATVLSLIRNRGAEPHTVLTSTHTWHSDEMLGEQDRRARDELSHVGLFSRGAIDQGLLNTVDAIAHPTVEYYGWVAGGYNGESMNYTILIGVGAGEAFALGRNSDHEFTTIATIPPRELLENVIAQLPALHPGKGVQLSAPESEVTGKGARDPGEAQIMQSNRPDPGNPQAAEIKRIMGLPRLGAGTLYVAARNRAGTRQRAKRPVNYIDTGEGRWLTEQAPGQGEQLVVCTPATPQLFASRLEKAYSTLG